MGEISHDPNQKNAREDVCILVTKGIIRYIKTKQKFDEISSSSSYWRNVIKECNLSGENEVLLVIF